LVAGIDHDGMGEEAQRGFEADHTLDAYTGLYRLVLLSYGYRCALTGARFGPPVLALHADLEVEAIQPREQGGPLTVANYLPMIVSLARPFREGLVTIDDDYRIVVPHPDLLDRTMLAALRTTLIVPDDAMLQPGPSFLAHHRRYALGA
jgi:predicted restriction endonuclease